MPTRRFAVTWTRRQFYLVCFAGLVCGGCSRSFSAPTDADASIDSGECQAASDCILTSVSCCGSCGEPTVGDMIALRPDALSNHQELACGFNPFCPACARPPDPNLIATCIDRACAAVNLADDPVSECTATSDCRVRVPDCCECGANTSSENLIAIATDQQVDLQSLVCEPDTDCATCLPVYPPQVTATCDSSGHCELQGL